MTLFEVVIAVSIMVLLLAAMFAFLWQFMEGRKQASLAADQMMVARGVLEGIAEELRGCIGVDQVGFPMEQGQRLIGDRRSITFLTTAVPERGQYDFMGEFDTPPPARHDLRQVGYSLWLDEENTGEDGEPIVGGIIRTEKKTLNQFIVDEEDPLDIRNDLWSHELGYLEFRYFDGVEWTTTWDLTEGNSLPHLIQVTIGFLPITRYEHEDQDLSDYPIDQPEYALGDDQPHPSRYSTIIRIPAADKLFFTRAERAQQQLGEQLGLEGLGGAP